jgi:transcriptional regulator with XRE-family HTH domain
MRTVGDMPTTAATHNTPAGEYERQINGAVAEEVRAAMARKRLTQTQLGRLLGLGQSAVSRRLSGEVPFDVVELHRIAEATGFDVETFIRTGSFASHLAVVDGDVLGQGTLLDEYLTPVPYFERPALDLVDS